LFITFINSYLLVQQLETPQIICVLLYCCHVFRPFYEGVVGLGLGLVLGLGLLGSGYRRLPFTWLPHTRLTSF